MDLVLAFDVFLGSLASPDGLAMGPDGTVYVAQESSGQVTAVTPEGAVYTAMTGLECPEGLAWHPELGILAVEDKPGGSLVSSVRGILQSGLANPEGVAVDSGGSVFYTWAHVGGPTGICRWTEDGPVAILTLPRGFMLSGITAGSDGMIYACNEMPLTGILASVIAVSPGTGVWMPCASGIPGAEGLRFTPDGGALMVVSEQTGSVFRVVPGEEAEVCVSGLGSVEDVMFLPSGAMLVSDDGAGAVFRVYPQ
jgi:sugar lactone lactonase YvrE